MGLLGRLNCISVLGVQQLILQMGQKPLLALKKQLFHMHVMPLFHNF